MKHEEVRKALVTDKKEYLMCPEHKTAEVARITLKTKSNTFKCRSRQDSELDGCIETEDPKGYLQCSGVCMNTIVA